jgi:hypothetical protein
MQSFSLFIVFAVLLINTQFHGANAFVCPNPGAPGNRKFAYCTRAITADEFKNDPTLKGSTMFSKFYEVSNLPSDVTNIEAELISCLPKQ